MVDPAVIDRILKESAIKAGRILMDHFLRKQKIWNKSPFELVTEADLASERAIITEVRRSFSDHTILTEEQGRLKGDPNHAWIVDPLDGTIKFVLGVSGPV